MRIAIAPFWIGLPVQWCGLVYRSSLQDLARWDPEQGDFWNHPAVGITRSGLQQTFPLEDRERQGLLPDFLHQVPEAREPPSPPSLRAVDSFDRAHDQAHGWQSGPTDESREGDP